MTKEQRIKLLCDCIEEQVYLIDRLEEDGIDSRDELSHLDYLRDELSKIAD